MITTIGRPTLPTNKLRLIPPAVMGRSWPRGVKVLSAWGSSRVFLSGIWVTKEDERGLKDGESGTGNVKGGLKLGMIWTWPLISAGLW